MTLHMLQALALSMQQVRSGTFHFLLTNVQVVEGGLPKRRLRKESFEAALCRARAPGTFNHGFRHTVTLCTGHS